MPVSLRATISVVVIAAFGLLIVVVGAPGHGYPLIAGGVVVVAAVGLLMRAGPGSATRGPSGLTFAAGVLGALPNVRVDGGHADVILLEKGLVFVPCPDKTDDGDKRVGALLAGHDPADLATRYRYLAYDDVATVRVDRPVPIDATLLLHDGRTVTVRERWTAERVDRSEDVFLEILSDLRDKADR
ncbi:hypothetical protein [Actinoplanes sp. HUAS TT8]|uniref:hypothetical protein n=1 Tax=Actinoplanes sp. HUAS TT8 TaxID=3447453 RepID=UPI003F5220D8